VYFIDFNGHIGLRYFGGSEGGFSGLHSYQYRVLGTASDISIVMYKQHAVLLP